MIEKMSSCVIVIGGNLPSEAGDPSQTLQSGIVALAAEGVTIRAISRFFTTPCFPAGAGPDFVNAALLVQSTLSPQQVLEALHRIEARFGRVRKTRWAGRTLDMDLMAVDNMILPDVSTVRHWIALPPEDQSQVAPSDLIVPHPRLQDRGFVLVPVADIVPDWRHPLLGKTVDEMMLDLPAEDIAEIRPI